MAEVAQSAREFDTLAGSSVAIRRRLNGTNRSDQKFWGISSVVQLIVSHTTSPSFPHKIPNPKP